MINYEIEERIGILAESNKISQEAATRLHAKQTKANPFADVADRLKGALRDSKMRKYGYRQDGKVMAAGERI